MNEIMKPSKERCLLKVEPHNKTSNIIFAEERINNVGIVIAIGQEANRLGLKLRDRVLFQPYAGTKVTLNGEDYLLIKTEYIIGIKEKEDSFINAFYKRIDDLDRNDENDEEFETLQLLLKKAQKHELFWEIVTFAEKKLAPNASLREIRIGLETSFNSWDI